MAGYPILGWVALSAYVAIYFGTWTWLLAGKIGEGHWAQRNLWSLAGAAAWVALEMVRRIADEIEGYVVERGDDGRLVALQLEELTGGVDRPPLENTPAAATAVTPPARNLRTRSAAASAGVSAWAVRERLRGQGRDRAPGPCAGWG